jgi:hypothetical protein
MSSNSVPLRPPMTRDAAGTLLGQTSRDLSALARILFWALIGLIVFGRLADRHERGFIVEQVMELLAPG